MKKFILLPVFLFAFATLVQAQKKPAKKSEEPQSMEEVMKQLQKEIEADPETKKAMEEMGITDMLKQVEKTTKEAEKKGVDVKAMTAAPD
ncbi:MAG TPA: hypothetical protein PLR74_00610, partial [Agriterribacter sp.]|nr:hypothetical protein [Agriterribacter sp.]